MRSILRIGAMFLFVGMFCQWGNAGWLTEARAQAAPQGASVTNLRTDPASPRTGDKIKLLFDPTQELVRADIKWAVNGVPVKDAQYDVNHTKVDLDYPIKAGDEIVASVTPYGAGGTQGKIVEHRLVCGNAPPVLSVMNQAISGSGVYTAKIEAKNPQGGAVTLKLEQGPDGLTMDPKGNIEWKLGKDKSGKFSVKVVGEDEQGQKTFLTYEIGIRWQR
jgi:hypothetical protein